MKKFLLVIMSFALITSGCENNSIKAINKNNNTIQYYFTKNEDHPEKALAEVINCSKTTLDIAIYSLSQKDIVNAIIKAKIRGVNIRIITDKQEAASKSEMGVLEELKDRGIPIKINCHDGLMHMKVSIIDESIVTTGSYNYTQEASTKNDEVLVIINSKQSAFEFEKQFNKMWEDKYNFQDY